MCGIAGVVGVRPSVEVLGQMAASLAHRGPDSDGFLLDAEAGLAFRRLSIIDVAGGDQPILNEDKSAVIIFNGEIYNYRELREQLISKGHRFQTKSDAETALHLWEDKGAECLSDLRGMFAMAIWNRKDRSLFLARDRVGKKPLYYAERRDGALVFGSEIKAILQDPSVSREPDPDAIDQFLTLQYVPSPATAFKGIRRLPPGSWLRWHSGSVEVKRYWQLVYEPKLKESEAELAEEVRRLLRESVAIRLESEVPLGAFLSGGIDSSAVVAFACEAISTRLKTFSIGFEASGFDESGYARVVAQHFNTDHHELVVTEGAPEIIDDIVWHYDQPFGDSSAIPSFHVARITRPHVTVVLNGDGGDESFAGYDRYQLSRYETYFRLPTGFRHALQSAARPLSRYSRRGRRLLRGFVRDRADAYFSTLVHLHPAEKADVYAPGFLEQLSLAVAPPLSSMRSSDALSPLDSMLRTDVNNYLPDDLLVKMDVATMAHGLEARSPFLDHRLMEFMARMPANMKLRHGESKYILKSALRDILPPAILNRRKMGFGVPLGAWLRTSLKEILVDTVASDRALARGYFKREAIEHMVEMQLAGSNRYQYLLWDLLILERWHQAFIDQVPHPRAPATAVVSSALSSL